MGLPPSSFQSPKDLRFVITLAKQGTILILQGLRASVSIDNAGGAMMGTLRAQIFGMTASDMNSLTNPQWNSTTIGTSGSASFGFNSIQVFAIDGAQETLVYNGDIINSWGVFSSMPEVYLYIEAQIGYAALVNPAKPLSIAAHTTVATVMQQIASAMGFQFENNGVNTPVARGAYWGNTLMEQARSLMQANKFWMYLDSTQANTLAIAPANTARNVAAALISPQTGLIGYPIFSPVGVNFETLFNPAIVFGGPVNVQKSTILLANGTWIVVSMSHQLSSQSPGGPWRSTVQAVDRKSVV